MRNLDKSDVVATLAEFLGELNALHPFREGNGRTQRSFVRQLAATAGWRLDWTDLEIDENINASIASMNKDYKPFERLLEPRVTVIRWVVR
jgi:cell filamentation protein